MIFNNLAIVLLLGFSQIPKQGQIQKGKMTMKKLMKTATLVASVGAILCLAGCGESTNTPTTSAKPSAHKVQSPVEELIGFWRKFNAELAKHGASPFMSEEAFSEIKNASAEDKDLQKQLATMRSAFPQLLVYSGVVKEANDLCMKLGGDPLVEKDKLAENFWNFMEKSSEVRKAEIADVQDALKRLKEAKR